MSADGAGLFAGLAAGFRWADPEPRPNPSINTTKANAINEPGTLLFTMQPLFSLSLFDVDAHYMTSLESDALAARVGWPIPCL